ncbi:MAG: class I mannose-6-phosphate isomerase [Bacteroidales bacterium]|nr:class I mannose-6-phosphate isomerase [Bacteroidales bacterium]
MISPLIFKDIYKDKIWGGPGIGRLKGLSIPDNIGESFEVSGLPGDESVVAEGEFEGQTLRQLTSRFGSRLVGAQNFARFGTDFPLLVKFISAGRDLSLQVHPDDAMAHTMGHPYGKNEMWFIVEADPESHICAGFSCGFSETQYLVALAHNNLGDHVNVADTHPGDCFYIPAGCIHAIGGGNLLIEIQQSSDDTFRVYDYDRVDANGHKRELHIEQARHALNFDERPSTRTDYPRDVEGAVPLVSCASFTTRACRFTASGTLDYAALDSFVIFTVYSGEGLFTDAVGNVLHLRAGRSALFPAENPAVSVEPLGGAPCCFLEASIP